MTQLYDGEFEDGLQHIIQNCGFPSFDEFKKNPDKWRRGTDDFFKTLDDSSQVFRKAIKETKYFWKDEIECKSLEMLERVAKEEGFHPDQLEMCPKKRSLTGTNELGGVGMYIQVWPKEEFRRLGGKVIHEA
jgi:hypothetical protein